MKPRNSLGPDQEENPARKESVSVASIVAKVKIVLVKIAFVQIDHCESRHITMICHQPYSGWYADNASDT